MTPIIRTKKLHGESTNYFARPKLSYYTCAIHPKRVIDS